MYGRSSEVELDINVDGLPLFKSCPDQLQPILGMYDERTPFLIAVFYGINKPDSAEKYLADFIAEMATFQLTLPSYEGLTYEVALRAFICEAPAECSYGVSKIKFRGMIFTAKQKM